MTVEQENILKKVAQTGSVPPDTFIGKGQGIGRGIGYVVSGLVRRGYLEWERGRAPHSYTATALIITDLGRKALSDAVGSAPTPSVPDASTRAQRPRE
jgi:hypothetical protein